MKSFRKKAGELALKFTDGELTRIDNPLFEDDSEDQTFPGIGPIATLFLMIIVV